MSGDRYFEIGIFQPKRSHNVGTLWRSAQQVGADGIFTIGRRYSFQTSDTFRTAETIPMKHFGSFQDFLASRSGSDGMPLIAVEMGGIPLRNFTHPPRAIYLLGSEDNGLPPFVLKRCDQIVSLEATGHLSYNMAVAGSILMYHRCFLS